MNSKEIKLQKALGLSKHYRIELQYLTPGGVLKQVRVQRYEFPGNARETLDYWWSKINKQKLRKKFPKSNRTVIVTIENLSIGGDTFYHFEHCAGSKEIDIYDKVKITPWIRVVLQFWCKSRYKLKCRTNSVISSSYDTIR